MNIEFAEGRDAEDSVRVAGNSDLRRHHAFRVSDFVPIEGADAVHVHHLRQGGAPHHESRRGENDRDTGGNADARANQNGTADGYKNAGKA